MRVGWDLDRREIRCPAHLFHHHHYFACFFLGRFQLYYCVAYVQYDFVLLVGSVTGVLVTPTAFNGPAIANESVA